MLEFFKFIFSDAWYFWGFFLVFAFALSTAEGIVKMVCIYLTTKKESDSEVLLNDKNKGE